MIWLAIAAWLPIWLTAYSVGIRGERRRYRELFRRELERRKGPRL